MLILRSGIGLRSKSRGFASALCILAMMFNLLSSVAYAETVRSASVLDGLVEASICHSAPEGSADDSRSAGKTAQHPSKCPLCQVSASGIAAPPSAPAVEIIAPVAGSVVVAPLPNLPVPVLALAICPEPRGPPSVA